MPGTITLFATHTTPGGYAKCNGQLLPIANNRQLFEILKTQYGGDGVSTFGLPNLIPIATDTQQSDEPELPGVRYITSDSGQVSLFAGTFVPKSYASSAIPDILLTSDNKTPDATQAEVVWYIKL